MHSSRSIWEAAAPAPAESALAQDLEADVAIVGGGITGVVCAYLLAQRGLDVVLLEARRLAGGTTGNSTGNLYAMVGRHQHALSDDDTAARVWKARAGAVNLIESIVRERQLDCSFVRVPWVLYSHKQEPEQDFDRIRRIASRVGLSVRDGAADVPFRVEAAIAIDQQAQFNPAAFVRRLAPQIPKCRIFENSAVTAIDSGSPARVITAAGSVRARWVVMATHTPKGALKVHSALAPYREYAIAAPPVKNRTPEGILWSTESPRHSLRSYTIDGAPHVVILGESHKTGQKVESDECYQSVLRYAHQHFGIGEPAYSWSAQSYRTSDALPVIGPSALGEEILYASGFAADGLTYGTLAASILADRITGKEHPDAKLFDSDRFTPLASAKDFIKENLNVAKQYLKDVPGHADADAFAQVRRGHGNTVELKGEKLAAYRDDDDKLHIVSAVCTHMGCIVAWNKAERSWDCPCHGSRFDIDGKILEGPALEDLPVKTP